MTGTSLTKEYSGGFDPPTTAYDPKRPSRPACANPALRLIRHVPRIAKTPIDQYP
jgi:hypothetical protein